MQAAGLPEGHNTLHPAVAFLAVGALAAFPPEHGMAEHSFPEVVGGLHALLEQESEQRVHLRIEMADKLPRFAVGVDIQRNQPVEPGIKCMPLRFGRRRLGHFAQAAQFVPGPGSASGQFRLLPFGQPHGPADQVGQATLPSMHPVLVQPIAVADQDALPTSHQGFKGDPGAMGVDHEEGDHRTGHNPEPVELTAVFPGGFVDMIDGHAAGLVPDRLVVGQDGPGGPIDNLLDRPEADRAAQHRGAERLDSLSAVAVNPADLRHQGAEAGAEAGLPCRRYVALARFAAGGARALIEDAVDDRHHDLGQLDMLVGVIGSQRRKRVASAGTRAGMDRLGPGRRHELLAVALVAFASTRLALVGLGRVFLVRRVGRRRLVGIGRVPVKPDPELIDFGLQFLDPLVLPDDMGQQFADNQAQGRGRQLFQFGIAELPVQGGVFRFSHEVPPGNAWSADRATPPSPARCVDCNGHIYRDRWSRPPAPSWRPGNRCPGSGPFRQKSPTGRWAHGRRQTSRAPGGGYSEPGPWRPGGGC